MNTSPFGINRTHSQSVSAEYSRVFLQKVYLYMGLGLLSTAGIAWYGASSQLVLGIAFNNPMLLPIVQLGIVFGLSFFIERISPMVAQLLFFAYSMLTGITFSTLFMIYTQASIVNVFLTTALTFGALSGWAMTTKKDLTGLGHFMQMGLIGLIIASIINFFLKSPFMEYLLSYLGVLIFTGLTAYDTQKLLHMGREMGGVEENTREKMAVFGALQLYLDFILIFVYLLRILGDRRD